MATVPALASGSEDCRGGSHHPFEATAFVAARGGAERLAGHPTHAVEFGQVLSGFRCPSTEAQVRILNNHATACHLHNGVCSEAAPSVEHAPRSAGYLVVADLGRKVQALLSEQLQVSTRPRVQSQVSSDFERQLS